MFCVEVWHSLEYTTVDHENNTTDYKENGVGGGGFLFEWNYDKKNTGGGFFFTCFALLLYRTCILVSNYKLFHSNCLVSFDVTFILLCVKKTLISAG